jgi:hypothetical protein
MKSASRLEIGVHCTLAKTTTRRLADAVYYNRESLAILLEWIRAGGRSGGAVAGDAEGDTVRE